MALAHYLAAIPQPSAIHRLRSDCELAAKSGVLACLTLRPHLPHGFRSVGTFDAGQNLPQQVRVLDLSDFGHERQPRGGESQLQRHLNARQQALFPALLEAFGQAPFPYRRARR